MRNDATPQITEACRTHRVGRPAQRAANLRRWVGKILPIERTFAADPVGVAAQTLAETEPWIDRLAGQSYHVPVERRGHNGIIDTRTIERALGDHIFAVLESRGRCPEVAFHQPDVVLVAEMIGDVAGIGLVPRTLCDRFSIVRID